MTTNTHAGHPVTVDAAPFPPLRVYALAQTCPTCAMPPNQPCLLTATYSDGRTSHLARSDVGNEHYQRDVAAAPWTEERQPGRCYCTIAAHRVTRLDDHRRPKATR